MFFIQFVEWLKAHIKYSIPVKNNYLDALGSVYLKWTKDFKLKKIVKFTFVKQ